MKNKEERLISISDLLSEYSIGNYDYEVDLSAELDEIDSIISGINMLGQELKETTISRDYFSGIYNASSDLIFVLNKNNEVVSYNKTIENYPFLNGSKLDGNVSEILALFKSSNQAEFSVKNNKSLYFFLCSLTEIEEKKSGNKLQLLVLKDITKSKKTDQLIMQKVVETQEEEQLRVANDLHDSLGQELSAIKMYLSNLTKYLPEDNKKVTKAYYTCTELLDNSISNLRNVCFNLMPNSLDQKGYLAAIEELAYRINKTEVLKVNVENNLKEGLFLDKNQEIALYRVTEEFINNSMKHANASTINIVTALINDQQQIIIEDDGKGFDIEKVNLEGRGMGTMKGRIETFNGTFVLESELELGTKAIIWF